MAEDSKDLYRPRKIPTQGRSQATFTAILDAAAQLLTSKGYAYASTNRIAEFAGVSIGSLYEYFPGKEAIYCSLKLRTNEEQFRLRTATIADGGDLPVREMIHRLITETLDALLSNPELEAALQSEVPAHILRDQVMESFEDMAAASLQYFVGHLDEIRQTNVESATWLGVRVPTLVIGHAIATEPERLRDEEFKQNLIDMMCRFWLKD